jgi:hypothetical protein
VTEPLVGGTAETEGQATFLLAWLRDRDVPCPLCAYNLRGLTSPRCPECGHELRLTVALTEPYLKAWLTMAVALLLPAGLGLLWIVIVPAHGLPGGPQEWLAVPILYQIACVPLASAAVVGRRRVQRWPRERQQLVAAVAVALAVVSFVWISRIT